ncbi:fam-h protein [Plasmodium relictum]|uniref:Fam-h protein n=1 Tax=Plasmodium relictum TaxID=85471 RepID=A0A1J1GKL0_PLARL|nr:fam-h protein [Plasmodium relictum]CRG84716.1 fam-h protein [Plasmodium relictum]
MNKKKSAISNVSLYPGYYSLVAKDFLIIDMLTLKIYNKKKKKKVLNYLMRFFMFTFLVWMLQCFDNYVSFRLWNYENELKNILNLGIKRSLTEKESKYREHVVVTGGTLESWNEKDTIRESINVKEGNKIEIKEKDQKIKIHERILGICKNNFELITSSVALIISIFSFMFLVINITSPRLNTYLPIFELSSLSILIISLLLTYEEIKIKRKKNLTN